MGGVAPRYEKYLLGSKLRIQVRKLDNVGNECFPLSFAAIHLGEPVINTLAASYNVTVPIWRAQWTPYIWNDMACAIQKSDLEVLPDVGREEFVEFARENVETNMDGIIEEWARKKARGDFNGTEDGEIATIISQAGYEGYELDGKRRRQGYAEEVHIRKYPMPAVPSLGVVGLIVSDRASGGNAGHVEPFQFCVGRNQYTYVLHENVPGHARALRLIRSFGGANELSQNLSRRLKRIDN